jgi:hypothetical protein
LIGSVSFLLHAILLIFQTATSGGSVPIMFLLMIVELVPQGVVVKMYGYNAKASKKSSESNNRDKHTVTMTIHL